MIKLIETSQAPLPGGHYSQAVVHNQTIYVSGILPITADGRKLTDTTIKEQMVQVLANLEAILLAAGSSKEKVLKTTIYITDVQDWGIINQLYAEFFGSHKPARSIVPINALHYGLNIELDAIATIEN